MRPITQPSVDATGFTLTILPRTPLPILPIVPVAILKLGSASLALSSPSGSYDLPAGRSLRRASTTHLARRLGEISNAARNIGTLPAVDETIHLIMDRTYHGWSAVGAILHLAAPAVIAEMIVATLGFNTRNAEELFQLMDSGRVQSVDFVASHYFEKANPEEFQMLRAGLFQRGQRCASFRTHAKVIGVKLTDGRCFVIETSANLRSCNNIEQLSLCQSREVFEFHQEWIQQLTALVAKCPATSNHTRAREAEQGVLNRCAM